MRKLVVIVGATATGKTALAVHLARIFGGEVVGADSRQVYRYMDIGTAKPTAAERALVRHHLVDVVDPDQPFSLAQYLELAQSALEDIWGRGLIPFLVGGSGQYVWALLEGWQVPRVPPDTALRRALAERAQREGHAALHRELATVDPLAAARIDPRNVRRVVRALEVYQRTGRPISACRGRRPPDCQTLIIGLHCPREELYQRIDRRVEAMVAAGLLEEVRSLLARGYSPHLPSMSGIGYKEMCQHLAGELSLTEAVQRIKTGSHRLARMQGTWFRRDDGRIRWLSANEAVGKARGLLEEFLRGGGEVVRRSFTVILRPETAPDFSGYYNALVPALPGCLSYGASREEALANIREAIQLYLEDLEAHGEPVPEERIELVGIEV